MVCKLNKHLIAHKLYIVFMFGATSSLNPFLTLHMKHLGLTIEEIAVISLIFPFLAAFCKPFVGIITDKTGRYKLILSIMKFTAGAFYSCLLLIPPVETSTQHLQKPTKSPFICWQNGALLLTSCNKLPDPSNWTVIELTDCSYECDSRKQNNPSLCLSSDTMSTCVALQTNDKFVISVLFKVSKIQSGQCRIDRSQMQGLLKEVKCPDVNGYCRVRCNSSFVENNAPLVREEKKSVSLTFWLYLSFRCIAEIALSSTFPIADAININLTTKFGGSFGRQRLLGLLAFGIFAFISGLGIDYVSQLYGSVTYVSCFLLYDFLVTLALISLYLIPKLQIESQKQSITKGLRLLLRDHSVMTLFVTCFALGIVWGYLDAFIYLYLSQKGASKTLIGLTQFVAVIPTIPVLYQSKWIFNKVKSANVLVISFFVYSIKCVGYVFMVNPWWSILLESTRTFTMSMPRIAISLYANELSVPEIRVTTQAIALLLYQDVGRGTGSLIGGTLKSYLGDIITFQIFAVYTGLFGCGYFAVYHFYLKDQRLKYMTNC